MLYGYRCNRCNDFWASQAHPEAGYAAITRFCPDCIVKVLPITVHIPVQPRRVNIETIMAIAADYFEISVDELQGSARTGPLAEARQVAMYLCRELTDMSLPKIGRAFGRNHTTVWHAENKIRSDIATNPDVFRYVSEITARIVRVTSSMGRPIAGLPA